MLRATGKGVTAETDEAVTASMVKELGMTNVVSLSPRWYNEGQNGPLLFLKH